MPRFSRVFLLFFLCNITFSPSIADEFDDLDALLDIPLDSLADTKVITATKTSLSLADVPAAVHVITAKQIERSSARSVADILVLAPGLHVTKFSDYDWIVSARSKNQDENNTLLVMIDGRSVVSPLYSGVNWDTLPVSIDSIDRIEVVLGPVGTLWGGNAVNGVVNIITKDAESSPNAQLSAAAGNYNYQEYKVHHSAQISENTHLAGYFEILKHAPFTDDDPLFQSLSGLEVRTERFGLRADYQNLQNTLSFQFGGIRSHEDYQWLYYTPAFLNPTSDQDDADVFMTALKSQEFFAGFQYLYEMLDNDQWENQVWLTYSDSDAPNEPASFTRLDLDSRYTFNTQDWGILTVGVNARLVDEKYAQFTNKEQYLSPYVRTIDEPDFLSQSYGLYTNWSFELTDSTEITLGNRFQYSNINQKTYSQPQLRALQKLSDNQRLWAGWGRSVITPSRLELDTQFQKNSYCSSCAYTEDNNGNREYYDSLLSSHYLGNRDLEMESVETYEIGYRYWYQNIVQVSLSLFYSQHDNVRAYQGLNGYQYFTADGSEHTSGTIIREMYAQLIDPLSQETIGGELSIQWQPMNTLQVNANYSYKSINGDCKGAVCGSNNLPIFDLENTPEHYATLHVMWDVHPTVWVSSVLNYVSESNTEKALKDADMAYNNNSQQSVWPEVITLDMSVHWQHKPNWPSLKLSVENLGNNQVKELSEQYNPYANGTQYYAQISWALR